MEIVPIVAGITGIVVYIGGAIATFFFIGWLDDQE
jgi:hypothetical protein